MVSSSVAPFTGAWIEIGASTRTTTTRMVAPFTGAWIEIRKDRTTGIPQPVAPFTGAWIEINVSDDKNCLRVCRSLHGSVD